MASQTLPDQKPHAVCIPFPAQGHITPILKLAKLLHHRGFYITFVNSESNHRRLLKSQDQNSLDSLSSFQFESIPDGLPPSDIEATQDIPSLCKSTSKLCLPYLKELLYKLNDSSPSGGVPPVTCIVSDSFMSFSLDAAGELGVPGVLFWTSSACGLLGYMQFGRLVDEGYTPLKDSSFLTNGYLDTVVDWIPRMNIRLRDLPNLARITDPNEFMLEFFIAGCERARRASAIILNTIDALEHDVVNALKALCPPIFTIGSLQHLLKHAEDPTLDRIGSNMWKEELKCLEWLDTKDPNSVVYVNFGSLAIITADQLIECAWGLANSGQTFLWIIRPDMVAGDSPVLPQEFLSATKERSMLASWCPQERVLNHPAIGGFLTHCGWNSILESICAGVPMVCCPLFAEQPTNCRYCCNEWSIGMEINSDVKRDEVDMHVRELMEGEKGKEMKKRAMEWKRLAEDATTPSGSSYLNLDEMINQVLRQTIHNGATV